MVILYSNGNNWNNIISNSPNNSLEVHLLAHRKKITS